MEIMVKSLLLLILTIHLAHADGIEGRWQLIITGQDRLEFGTEQLAGGLQIRWQSVLDFRITEGVFKQGTGTARLLPDILPFSRPPDMFDCHQESGTFASNTGQSFSTPHLRYRSFPMQGRVTGSRVILKPFLEYPGNYYAVLYACKTDKSLGSFWLENAPRIARELSKRQNAQLKAVGPEFNAHIKEVKNIAPGPELEIPLIEGLSFSLSEQYGLRQLHYELIRVEAL